jgi:hypothetical protein
VPRQLALVDVPSRRCTLCGAPYGRPNRSCARCSLRRDPLPCARHDPELEAKEAAAAAAAAARLTRLRALDRPIRVGLVGCSDKKRREGIHPARKLYRGNFFRRSLPIAEATCDEVWILSARHGLVALDQPLGYYNEPMATRRKDREYWGANVLTGLANSYLDLPLHLVILAGALYVEGLTGYEPRTGRCVSFNAHHIARLGWSYETPLEGLDRPARFRWFAAQESLGADGGTPPARASSE